MTNLYAPTSDEAQNVQDPGADPAVAASEGAPEVAAESPAEPEAASEAPGASSEAIPEQDYSDEDPQTGAPGSPEALTAASKIVPEAPGAPGGPEAAQDFSDPEAEEGDGRYGLQDFHPSRLPVGHRPPPAGPVEIDYSNDDSKA